MLETTPTDAAARRAVSGSDLWLLYALAAVLVAGYGVLFTLVGDYGTAYGLSESMLGLMIGIGFIVSFVSQTLLGPLGDRGYVRWLIIGGSAANVIGLLLMGFGTTATVLMGGRVLSGLGMGAAAPAIKRLVVTGSDDDVGANLGRLFSADVFGFAIGPVVSAILAGPFGIPAPFIVIAVMNVGLLAVLFSRVDIPEAAAGEATRFAFDLLKNRGFAGAVIIGSAAFAMIGAFDALWDLVHEDLGTAPWISNLGIALFAIPLVLLGPFSGRLSQRRGPFLVAAIGLSAAALFMGTYGVLSTGIAIFAVTMLHALTDGLSFASSGVAVGITVPKERQAGAQGVLGGMQSLVAGFMAPITATIYEHFGQRAAYWTAAVVIVAMVVVGLAIAGPARRVKSVPA